MTLITWCMAPGYSIWSVRGMAVWYAQQRMLSTAGNAANMGTALRRTHVRELGPTHASYSRTLVVQQVYFVFASISRFLVFPPRVSKLAD